MICLILESTLVQVPGGIRASTGALHPPNPLERDMSDTYKDLCEAFRRAKIWGNLYEGSALVSIISTTISIFEFVEVRP